MLGFSILPCNPNHSSLTLKENDGTEETVTAQRDSAALTLAYRAVTIEGNDKFCCCGRTTTLDD